MIKKILAGIKKIASMSMAISALGLVFYFCPVFGVDELLETQQAAKEECGTGYATNNCPLYLNGILKMQSTGVGNSLIDYIKSTYPLPSCNFLITDGMIGLPTFPVISKYMLLVDPAVYNSLSPNETILQKDVNLFSTIQGAINYAVADPNNPTTLSRWTILVAPGTYNENLSIGTALAPSTSVSVTLAALGRVIVGDGVTTGSVSWYLGQNTLLSGSRYQSLMFSAYRTESVNYNARWVITKDFNTIRTASISSFKTVLLQLQYVTVNGNVNGQAALADFFECVFNNSVTIDPTNTASYLMVAQGCLFNHLLSTYHIAKITGCVFNNGISCHDLYTVATENIYGFYRSQIAGSCSITSGSFLIDDFTNTASTATFSSKTIMQ